MGGAGNDLELVDTAQGLLGLTIQPEYVGVQLADDQERRRRHVGELRTRKVYASAPGDHRARGVRTAGRRPYRGGSAGACAEVSDREIARAGLPTGPLVGRGESLCQ